MILPTSLPFFSRPELERLSTLPYGALLEHILCAIIDDSELPHDEIRKAVAQVEQATSGVTTVHLKNSFHVLELFSGPTLAFKDYGLQLLAALIDLRGKNRRSLVVATSGDTGPSTFSFTHGSLFRLGGTRSLFKLQPLHHFCVVSRRKNFTLASQTNDSRFCTKHSCFPGEKLHQ